MVKINLMRLCVLAVVVLFGTSVSAQTVIWGAGASVGVADGEFQNNFVQAGSFTAGDNPTAWTALSVSQSGGTVTPGAAYWTRSLIGYSQGAYWSGTTPITSPSQANGVAIFDSDFLDNAGTAGAFGTGTSPTPHRGELISPRIDLTGYTDSALTVRFYSLYRNFQINELSVSLSVDDGQTWVETVDWRALQPNLTQGFVNTSFTAATQGVAILNQCRIRFTFDNDYYFAIIDDVSIEVANAFDIALGGPEPGSNLLIGSGDNVKVGGHPFNPLLRVLNTDPTAGSNDLREWFWGAKVVNRGAEDLLPANNPKLFVQIDYVDPLTGNVTAAVYMDSVDLDTLVAGDASGETNIEYLSDLNFIQTYGEGQYNVTYWAAHDGPDGDPTNDTARHNFTITGGAPLGNYVSKARLSANDGRVFASRGIFPGGNPPSAFEYGSVFFFPRGASDTITIDSIDFRYRLSGTFSGAATQTLFCNIYQMDASQSATLNNTSLLTQVGIAPVSLNGLGTTTAAGDFGLTTISGFVDASTGGPMPGLVDNGFYYVSILIQPSATGGAATFTGNDVPLIGADENNFYMNAALTRVDSVINPSPLRLTDAAGVESWFWTGFGADLIPSLGLHLGINPQFPVATETVWATEGAELNVYPNPVADVLNIEFSLEQSEDVTYILTDMTGRVVNMIKSNNVTNEVQTMNMSNLSAGVYLITALTEKGSSTKKFIKQ